MNTYEEFKDSPSSEKITLVKIGAAKRLMAWALDTGSIYRIDDFDYSDIEEITEDGTPLTQSLTLAGVTAGKWFNDREGKAIYLRTTGSVNPNGVFISMRFWNFWSNVGVTAPMDLATGTEVYWLPILKGTSQFGVELDNEEQIGFAIEGSGSVNCFNDKEYWHERFEKWLWELQPVYIYSWTREIPITEAKVIYKGMVNGKSWSSTQVSFKLKDQLANLRSEFPLGFIKDLSSVRVPEAILEARQRRIYGKVYGYRPTNLDEVVDGYELTGSVAVSSGTDTITGTSTTFLSHFSPDDEIIFLVNGELESFTVKAVASNTVMTVNDTFDVSASGLTYYINPALPKRFINRVWLVAGHECRHVETTVSSSVSSTRFYVTDGTDLDVGDEIFVGSPGSGEVVTIEQINSDGLIRTAQSLVTPPSAGTSVVRFAAQNVRINSRKLIYDRDYTLSFSGGITRIILDEEAEKNINPTRAVIGSVTITNTSRVVTGTGTVFTSQLAPNQWIRGTGNFDYYEILSVDSDTQLTLRTPAGYSDSGDAEYIAGFAFDTEAINTEPDVLSCDVIGTTDDGTKSGTLLRTGSKIVQDMAAKVDITDVNQPAFDKAHDVQPAYLGIAIPDVFSETKAPVVRDLINRVNLSVFGSLVQNEDYELEYNILRPNKPASFTSLDEADILNFSIENSNERVVKTALVVYQKREYDFESGLPSIKTQIKTSNIGNYLILSQNTKTIETLLHIQREAEIHAGRWAFLLEISTNVVKVQSKLKPMRLQVNDIIRIEHEKLFDRVGGGQRKFAAVQAIRRSGSNTEIELDDLANAFNRVCIISETGSPIYDDATEQDRARLGFITDQYGLINNEEQTFGLNLIW